MARSCSGWSTANYFSRADAAIQDEPLTLALWFTVTDLTTNQFMFSLSKSGAAPGGYYSLVFAGATANDPLRADKANDAGTAGSATVNTSASTNTWYFTAATFGSDTARSVYFGNAGVVTSGSDTTSVTNPTVANQSVGALKRSTVTAPASGSLALATIWDAVLSLEEITALAKGVHPARMRPKNIVRAWWNPTAGSRLVDFSGGQNTLTLTGTVTDDAFGPPVEPFPYYFVPFLGIGAPTIGGGSGDVLSGNSVQLTFTADALTFKQVHALATNEPKLALSAETATFSVLAGLAVNSAQHVLSADATTFNQLHRQAVNDAQLTFAAETGSFTVLSGFVTATAQLALSAETGLFAQTHRQTVNDAQFNLSAETGTFGQTHRFATNEPIHTLSADQATFTVLSGLILGSPQFTLSADAASFAQGHKFAANDPQFTFAGTVGTFAQGHKFSTNDGVMTFGADTASFTSIDSSIPPTLNAATVQIGSRNATVFTVPRNVSV